MCCSEHGLILVVFAASLAVVYGAHVSPISRGAIRAFRVDWILRCRVSGRDTVTLTRASMPKRQFVADGVARLSSGGVHTARCRVFWRSITWLCCSRVES